MTYIRKHLGSIGETLAIDYLEQHGLTIVERNLRLKTGEIDLLAQDGDTLVVVEVKLKTSRKFGHPAEMVHFHKQKKLLLLARELFLKYPHKQVRIDVVAVDISHRPPVIEYFRNAVTSNK